MNMWNLQLIYSKFINVKLLFIIVLELSRIPLCRSQEVAMQIIVPHLSEFQRALPSVHLLEKERIKNGFHKEYPNLRRKLHVNTYLNLTHNLPPNEILNLFCKEIFEKNVNVITLINNKDASEASNAYILRLADHLGYPVINWDTEYPGALQSNDDSRVLQIAPTLYHQCQGMIHLLNRYNWTEFTIVTTKISSNKDFVGCMEEMVRLRGVTHGYITKYRFTLTSVIEIDADSEAKIDKALAVVKQNTVRVFLLHAKSDEAKSILDRAERMGLTSEIYMWILTSSSIGIISNRASSSYPIGSLGFSSNRSVAVIEQALRSAIKVWALGLEEISKHQDIFAHTNLVPNMTCNSSFLNGFWKDGKILYTYMKKSKFDDPPVSFSDNGVINHATLDVYNVQPFYDKTKMFRKWGPVGKLLPVKNSTGHIEMVIQMNEITWPGRSTFPPKGKPDRRLFRIATLSEPPYVIYINPDETTGKCGHHAIPCQVNATRFENLNASFNGDVCCTGLCIDLLTMLSQTMDFDFVMYEINDTKWGIKDEITGEWNGLIRELVDHKSDFVMTSLKINHQRSSAIDFSVPFMETGITIIVSIRKGAISPTAFLEPFDLTSWLLILMLSINIVALTICLMEWYSPQAVNKGKGTGEPYDYPSWCLILVFSVHATGASIFIFEWLSPSGLDHGKTPLREHKFSLFRSFWLIWAMLFGASVSVDNPRGVSSRFLANVWALFALVFLASYTANLAAFMITIDDYYKLSGIQDWRLMNPTAVTPHFRFATVPGGSTEDNLKKNYPRMHKYMMKYNKSTVQEGISALKRQEIHAFIYDSTVLEYWAGRDPECDLKTVGKWYAMTGYGIGFPRGSKYIDEFNKVLLEFQNNGEMERLQKFWLAGACHARKDKKKDQSSHEIGILNFTSAFILLACGVVLGTILLGLEHSYFRFGRKCLKKYDKCGCCALVSLSMGKSLTFEQSVIEAIDFHKKHRCKDAVCETQLWKARHELDLALLKIERLRRELMISWKPIEYPAIAQEAKTEPNGITALHQKTRDSDKDHDNKAKADDGKSDIQKTESKPENNMELDVSEVDRKRAVFRRSPSYTNAMSCESDGKPCDSNPEVRRSPSYTQAVGKEKYDAVNPSVDNPQDRPKPNARFEDETLLDIKIRPRASNRTRFYEGKYYTGVEDGEDESSL